MHVVIDEAALRRPVGSAPLMTKQLDRLTMITAQERVTVQVVELATAWSALAMPFTVLRFPDAGHPDVACMTGFGGKPVITTHVTELTELREAFARLVRAALPAASSAGLISELAARAGKPS